MLSLSFIVVVINVFVFVVVTIVGGLTIMGNGFCYRLAHLSIDELLLSPNAWEEPQKVGGNLYRLRRKFYSQIRQKNYINYKINIYILIFKVLS